MIINDGYMILLFDLPVKEKIERKKYQTFKRIINSYGYQMIHKSVYYKYLREMKYVNEEINKIEKVSPKTGDIKMIKMSKLQFQSIIAIEGNKITSDDSKSFVED